jgi:tetratricopeptide (TPR) repeat protein
MKKLFIITCAAMLSSTAFAQNAEVVNAYNYQRYGELGKAREAIDKAINDAKTGVAAKTWFYRGNIYLDIAESPDAAVKALDANAINVAYQSYVKATELDAKKQYQGEIKSKMPMIANRLANKGIAEFKNKDFTNAITSFETSVMIGETYFNKLDTSLLYNAAIAAQNAKDEVKAKQLISRLIDLKYPEPELYRFMANMYKAEKDTTKALEYIQMGKAAFPTNNVLMIEELNIYMARGQSKQMVDKMEAAAAADPANKTLWFALGTTYDAQGKKDAAEKAYLKALEVDPDYFDALYNLGALHYNAAVEVYNKTNDLPVSKQKEFEAGKAKYTAEFNKALPHLEKALSLQPDDRNTMISLKEIYAKLNNTAKANEMKKRLEKK